MIFSREQDKADDLIRAISDSLQIWAILDKRGGFDAEDNECHRTLERNYLRSLDKVAEAFGGMQWALEK